MSVGKIVWSVLSLAIAYGVNTWARPQFDTHYDAAEYSQEAGTLNLSAHGANSELPLMATHIVCVDVERMGRKYQLRELSLRAIGADDARLELYAGLAGLGDLGMGARDPAGLLQHELPLLPSGRFGARPSYLAIEGNTHSKIVSGSLMLTDVTQTEFGDKSAYSAMGRLEVQVQTAHGIEMVTGKWTGRLIWDPEAAPAK
jgi:hypothetical protein